MNLSLFKQGMRKEENLHDTFLFNRDMRKEVRSHICDRPRVPPLTLATEACPPYPPTIDRITKQRYKPRAKPKNQEQKRKKGKPMHKRTKNETKRKKKIKITTCMLFSSLLKHTHKRNTYFFSFINGQQKPSK